MTSTETDPESPLLDRGKSGQAANALEAMGGSKPTLDRIVNLLPGFVYLFNHVTFSNDYANRSVAEYLGYTAEEIRALGPEMMMRIVHDDDHHLISKHMTRIAGMDDDSSARLDYRVTNNKGEQRWLRSVDAVFDRDSEGKVLRHIGFARDVTDEKESALALERMNAKLESMVEERTRDLATLNDVLECRIIERTAELQDAVDELEQLTYIATHDLKVPVNNLCRLGLMLNDTKDLFPPEQAEQVGWINDCAAQLAAKIQGLVLVAQIRLGSDLPAHTLNLRAAIELEIQEFKKSFGPRMHPIRIDVPDEITVEFARFELSSILASLIDNAIKYAERSRPLEIRFAAVGEANCVRLRVSDNGTGLDGAKDSVKVFGLFQRAHKVPAGSGISLYCARRMLLKRGGDISVEGTRGAGATFELKFPSVKAEKT